MRIIITTGGTGGHIFPAIALIKEIQRQNPSAYILFVGAEYGMEKEICEKENIPFVSLNVRGFVGRGFKSISALFLLYKAYFQAKKIVREYKIDTIVGFGGYASAPSILAARALKKNIFLAEQNAFPGAVNRYFADFANTIMLSIPVKEGLYNEEVAQKCVITGNPVREEIAQYADSEVSRTQSKKLLILGGSLGAQSINSLIISLLDDLHEHNIEITHQCGKSDFERVKEAYTQSKYPTSCVHAFVDDMQSAYANADFIIARAGASTIAEIACVAKATIFIPFPHAAHNHQFYNAQSLLEKNACLLIEEKEIYQENTVTNKELLLEKILYLAENADSRYTLACNVRTFAKKEATKEMYTIIKG